MLASRQLRREEVALRRGAGAGAGQQAVAGELLASRLRMPLFGRRDPAKKPKKEARDAAGAASIDDKYVLKEQLGT